MSLTPTNSLSTFLLISFAVLHHCCIISTACCVVCTVCVACHLIKVLKCAFDISLNIFGGAFGPLWSYYVIMQPLRLGTLATLIHSLTSPCGYLCTQLHGTISYHLQAKWLVKWLGPVGWTTCFACDAQSCMPCIQLPKKTCTNHQHHLPFRHKPLLPHLNLFTHGVDFPIALHILMEYMPPSHLLHVFIRTDSHCPPLDPPYQTPCPVVSSTGQDLHCGCPQPASNYLGQQT